MSYILYTNSTSVTGRQLRDALDIKGGTLIPQERHDVLIRWGSVERVPKKPRRVINSRNSILLSSNKLEALRIMRDRNVHTPEVFTHIPPIGIFPVLGRASNHMQGRDIVLCMQLSDAERTLQGGDISHFTRYIPTKAEFRVHVFEDEILKISEKILTEEAQYNINMPWVRNVNNGYTFRNVRRLNPDMLALMENLAVRAVRAIGLNFGAVDIILGDDLNLYVLEINTGPSLSDASLEVYVELFNRLLNREELPDVAPMGDVPVHQLNDME